MSKKPSVMTLKRTKRPKRHSASGKLVAEADAWVKAIVENRQQGLCLRAPYRNYPPMVACGGPLQGAHILRKGGLYSSIRHELENVVCLCRNHHMFWAHIYEHDFYEWIEQLYPGRIAKLKQRALQHRKIDLKELICVLKDIHRKESGFELARKAEAK